MTPLTSSELDAVIDYTVIDKQYFSSLAPFKPFVIFLTSMGVLQDVLLMLNDKGFITYGAICSYVADTLYDKGSADIARFNNVICNTTERIVNTLVHCTYAVKTDQDYLKITLAGKAVAHVICAIRDLSGLIYNNFMDKKHLGFKPKYGSCLEAQVNATLLGHPEWTEKEFFDKYVAWLFSAKATKFGIFTYLQKIVIGSLLFDKYLPMT